MIDYEALSCNCIMLRFQILQNVITLNSAAYEIFFLWQAIQAGVKPRTKWMLVYIIECLAKLTCVMYRNSSSKWLNLTPHCRVEGSQRWMIVGTVQIEDSATVWTFHLHPSRVFWLLQQIWCPFNAVGLVWHQQKLARSAGSGAKWQWAPETKANITSFQETIVERIIPVISNTGLIMLLSIIMLIGCEKKTKKKNVLTVHLRTSSVKFKRHRGNTESEIQTFSGRSLKLHTQQSLLCYTRC